LWLAKGPQGWVQCEDHFPYCRNNSLQLATTPRPRLHEILPRTSWLRRVRLENPLEGGRGPFLTSPARNHTAARHTYAALVGRAKHARPKILGACGAGACFVAFSTIRFAPSAQADSKGSVAGGLSHKKDGIKQRTFKGPVPEVYVTAKGPRGLGVATKCAGS
jgi:hypothetical protein